MFGFFLIWGFQLFHKSFGERFAPERIYSMQINEMQFSPFGLPLKADFL